jgi:hypothetical protein
VSANEVGDAVNGSRDDPLLPPPVMGDKKRFEKDAELDDMI